MDFSRVSLPKVSKQIAELHADIGHMQYKLDIMKENLLKIAAAGKDVPKMTEAVFHTKSDVKHIKNRVFYDGDLCNHCKMNHFFIASIAVVQLIFMWYFTRK